MENWGFQNFCHYNIRFDQRRRAVASAYTKMQITTMWSFFILLIGLLLKETTQVSAIRIRSLSAILSSSKPGCPERCGNLTIPYPFGIGKGCYFDEPFEVRCNNNTAFSRGLNDRSVKHISMDTITIVIPFSPYPYNKSSGKNLYGDEYSTGKSIYEYFSVSIKNNLVAIGCDIYAYIKDLDNTSRRQDNIVSGCASFCDSGGAKGSLLYDSNNASSSASSTYCTGNNGCCQSAFSRMPIILFASIQTMNTEKTSWTSSNCTYFLVVEKGIAESEFSQLLGKCKKDDYYKGRQGRR